jgi:hypothetical protein
MFIETEQCRELWQFLERNKQSITVIVGPTAAGKSVAARQYVSTRTNTSDTIVYWEAIQADGHTEQSVYTSVLKAVSGQQSDVLQPAPGLAEVKRELLQRHVVQILVDEAHFLTKRGLEAVRLLHEETGVGFALITLPEFIQSPQRGIDMLQGASKPHEFAPLSTQQVRVDVLPQLARQCGYTFDADQSDADDIIAELVQHIGDPVSNTMNFRELVRLADHIREGVDGIRRAVTPVRL